MREATGQRIVYLVRKGELWEAGMREELLSKYSEEEGVMGPREYEY